MKKLHAIYGLIFLLFLLSLSVESWAKTVTLSWDASPSSVTGYRIYYVAGSSSDLAAAASPTVVDVGNVLTYTLTSLDDAAEHSFAVTAYDGSGNESVYSNVVTSAVVSTSEVDSITSSDGETKTVTLSWDASPSSVTGYRIYYVTGSAADLSAAANPSSVDVGNVLTYTFSGLDGTVDHSFAVTAYDSSGNESIYSNVVTSSSVSSETTNSAPVLASIGNKSTAEGLTLSFLLSASDADGDSLTYSVSGLPTGASFSSQTGSFSWVPSYIQSGTYNLTFSVSDGNATDSETIVVSVNNINRSPVLTTIGSRSVAEGSALSISLSASDADGDDLIFGASGLPTGAVFTTSNGTFSWTPATTQAGSYPVVFSVTDGSASDSETVTITVSNTNQAPVLNSVGNKTVNEGSTLSFTISGTDADNDALTYSATGLPDGATFNPTTRQFSWPTSFDNLSVARTATATFSVTDGLATDSETITITVANVNRAPVISTIGAQTLTEGDDFTLVVEASDPDGNSLAYSASNLPQDSVFVALTRSFSWIPGNDQAGTYQVTFSVSDGSLTASQTVSLTVNNGNEAPVLAPIGAQSVAENSLLSLTLSASDENSDSLTYSAAGLPEGATFDSAAGQFRWTPNFSQAGSFSVDFSVSDGTLGDSETVQIVVTNTNQAPTISGSPGTSVMATTSYSFAPSVSDPDGDSLSFTISNKPSWATFDAETGTLSGTPGESHIGTTSNIQISVSDGAQAVSLPAFSLDVVAFVYTDTDGDGITDDQDAFPNDASEWLDTDGDQIGNNADDDDDNDGIADSRDGAPLDAASAGWIITATAEAGGYISPDGESSVLYGGSQAYAITPMAGHYISDVLIDGSSVGLIASYVFEDVSQHHSITARFIAIPEGLSCDPTEAGLIGVARLDGGSDLNNYVDGKPKQDLDFRFGVTLKDSVTAAERKVYLLLDGYKYQMTLGSGVLASGASYSFTTRMGPSPSHSFYFVAEDNSGNQLWRYPQSGELTGPAVELLNGMNLVGAAINANPYGLSADEAFGQSQVYRWIPDQGPKGTYEQIFKGAPVTSGEGYVIKKALNETLPDTLNYGQISDTEYLIPVKAGWNLISNPYGGNVNLGDIWVQPEGGTAVPWLSAVDDNLVVDVIYSYLGADWGGANEFSSAGGAQPAVMVPWIGYWIYANTTDQPLSLILKKPLH